MDKPLQGLGGLIYRVAISICYKKTKQRKKCSFSSCVKKFCDKLKKDNLTLAIHKGTLDMARTKRAQNRCKDCGYTWYPKGKNLSRRCPSCGGSNVTYAGCGCLGLVVVGIGIAFFASMLSGPRESAPPAQLPESLSPSNPSTAVPTSGHDFAVGTKTMGTTGSSTATALQATLAVPTDTRTWRSIDGRELIGKVTGIDLEKGEITIVRADGQVYSSYPLSKLHPDDVQLIAPQYSVPKK
ncbi:hypothetical protein [Verrucomicrobium spinosum]|uniref:hypothetical protein n=1 Tax=Verrucomicrobium spinosum TaxID=2736 RepID=UPI0012F6405C|nr:hypothetical protein [Verrucomicrobium spinosum]